VKVALATVWRPRGEHVRLERLRPYLEAAYDLMVVALPPMDDVDTGRAALTTWPKVRLVTYPERFAGRYRSVEGAVESGADYIHYADFDMLAHWIETRPDEWRRIVEMIATTDCLVVGRTRRALETRPRAIQDTERIINAVFSHVLGQTVDLGLGCRGLSRRAAEVVLRNSEREGWPDATWPVLIQRAGFEVRFVEVDGVDWESPDFYRDDIADQVTRQRAADEYDLKADRWAARVRTAREIIEQGLAAVDLPLVYSHV
jgi:hypothetical protein